MNALSEEILLNIFKYVPLVDRLQNVQFVSKQFNRLVWDVYIVEDLNFTHQNAFNKKSIAKIISICGTKLKRLTFGEKSLTVQPLQSIKICSNLTHLDFTDSSVNYLSFYKILSLTKSLIFLGMSTNCLSNFVTNTKPLQKQLNEIKIKTIYQNYNEKMKNSLQQFLRVVLLPKKAVLKILQLIFSPVSEFLTPTTFILDVMSLLQPDTDFKLSVKTVKVLSLSYVPMPSKCLSKLLMACLPLNVEDVTFSALSGLFKEPVSYFKGLIDNTQTTGMLLQSSNVSSSIALNNFPKKIKNIEAFYVSDVLNRLSSLYSSKPEQFISLENLKNLNVMLAHQTTGSMPHWLFNEGSQQQQQEPHENNLNLQTFLSAILWNLSMPSLESINIMDNCFKPYHKYNCQDNVLHLWKSLGQSIARFENLTSISITVHFIHHNTITALFRSLKHPNLITTVFLSTKLLETTSDHKFCNLDYGFSTKNKYEPPLKKRKRVSHTSYVDCSFLWELFGLCKNISKFGLIGDSHYPNNRLFSHNLEAISRLQKLKYLHLINLSHIDGVGFLEKILKSCKYLSHLTLVEDGQIRYERVIAKNIHYAQHLQVFCLSQNSMDISGKFLSSFCSNKNLHSFSLIANKGNMVWKDFEKFFLEFIKSLRYLEVLELYLDFAPENKIKAITRIAKKRPGLKMI